MEQTINYLFVYGTLLDNRNEFAIYLKQNCSFYTDGKLKGLLFDIGEYPGVVLQTDTGGFVYGDVFQINSVDTTLKILDEYEGFGNNELQPNEFIRKIEEINTPLGLLKCWIYLYNLPFDSLKPILSGNYLQYIQLGTIPEY